MLTTKYHFNVIMLPKLIVHVPLCFSVGAHMFSIPQLHLLSEK